MGIDIYDSANVLMLRIKAMSSAECQQWKDHINNCLDTVTNMTSAEEIASRNERVMSKHGQGRASSKLTKRSSDFLMEARNTLSSVDRLSAAISIVFGSGDGVDVIYEGYIEKKADKSKSIRFMNSWKPRFLRLTSDIILVYTENKDDMIPTVDVEEIKGVVCLSSATILKHGTDPCGIDIYDDLGELLLRFSPC